MRTLLTAILALIVCSCASVPKQGALHSTQAGMDLAYRLLDSGELEITFTAPAPEGDAKWELEVAGNGIEIDRKPARSPWSAKDGPVKVKLTPAGAPGDKPRVHFAVFASESGPPEMFASVPLVRDGDTLRPCADGECGPPLAGEPQRPALHHQTAAGGSVLALCHLPADRSHLDCEVTTFGDVAKSFVLFVQSEDAKVLSGGDYFFSAPASGASFYGRHRARLRANAGDNVEVLIIECSAASKSKKACIKNEEREGSRTYRLP